MARDRHKELVDTHYTFLWIRGVGFPGFNLWKQGRVVAWVHQRQRNAWSAHARYPAYLKIAEGLTVKQAMRIAKAYAQFKE